MQPEQILNLKPGDRIDVKFGRNFGRQLAVVVRVSRYDDMAMLRVRKYRKRSASWTGEVIIPAADVIERNFTSPVPSPVVVS